MNTKRFVSVILAVLLLLNVVGFSASAKTVDTAQTGSNIVEITSYEQLRNYAKNAQGDIRYVLAGDIEQNDNTNDYEIVVESLSDFNLDLNGYYIKRATLGNDLTLFRIRNGGRMMIRDSSLSRTGYCYFSEGYSSYHKSVFNNEGGELEIINGYYEIFSPFEQGDCCILRTTSGNTKIYGGTFDSSSAFGGDTISVGHDSYMYDTPFVTIYGGQFYGKYQNIDISSMGNYLKYAKEYPNGALHPAVFVHGGNFYICNGGKDGEWASFAYCNNGWGRVIVSSGTVLAKCLNNSDQRFLDGVSKKMFTETIDNYTGTYYKVTPPPMITTYNVDYSNRVINLSYKSMVNSYDASVHEIFKEQFDEILGNIDTHYVDETEKESPYITLTNRTTDHKYIRWYLCNGEYEGENTEWTYLGELDDVSRWQPPVRPEDATEYYIRCVVTNSDLTTFENIFCISYESLKKAEVITSVNIKDVDAPTKGAHPDFDVTLEDGYYLNDISWIDVDTEKSLMAYDTFEAGHTYELQLWLRTSDGYKFRTDYDGWIDITATVDSKEAEVVLPGAENAAIISLTYTVEDDAQELMLGDVDGDTKITIMDTTEIQRYIAKANTLTDDALLRADTDKDTKITIMDATAIQRYIAKLISEF